MAQSEDGNSIMSQVFQCDLKVSFHLLPNVRVDRARVYTQPLIQSLKS
jgi:hypothetical protein